MPPERITAEELLAAGLCARREGRFARPHRGARCNWTRRATSWASATSKQTRQVLTNLEAQLDAAGSTPADVVKIVIFVAAEGREDLNGVWEVVRTSPFDGVASTSSASRTSAIPANS